jgi:hypothetical protein
VPKGGVPKQVPKDVPKSEVPKIVYDRLRTAAPEPDSNAVARAHPDADLLTAFAEQALSAPEREEVLHHLALCGNCREVLSLADVLSLAIESVNDSVNSVDAPPVPISTESESESAPVQTAAIRFAARKNWRPVFAWPNLRWAGLAAGVAIVATVLVLQPGKQNHAAKSATSPSIVASVPRAADSEVALSSSKQSTSNEPFSNQSVSNQSTILAKSDTAQNDAESPSSGRANLNTEPRFAARLADNKKSNGAPFAGGALMARNYAPAIEKAKPALLPQETQTTGAIGTTATTATNAQQKTGDTTGFTTGFGSAGLGSTASPETSAAAAVADGPRPGSPSRDVPMRPVMWAVAAGLLQRSVDAGQTWQITLHADRPLLTYASLDQDVWAGGEAGALFHSADSGATWTRVQPSIKGQTLSSDITQIDISNSDVSNNDFLNGENNDKLYRRQNLEHIVVSTGSHEVWRSADGGITWNKQ